MDLITQRGQQNKGNWSCLPLFSNTARMLDFYIGFHKNVSGIGERGAKVGEL
jgi:hypothetical protein